MRVLGFESSCDETAVAVVEDGHRVLASVVQSQDELHKTYGGVVPEIAGRAHAERIGRIADRTLTDADMSFADIDAVAVAHRPGLIGSVLVGVAAAKSVAWRLGVPLIGVHHVEAHLRVLGCQRPPRNGGVLCAAGLAQLVEHLGVREPLLRRDHRAVVRRQRRDQRAHQLMLLRASLATRLGLHLRAARPSL